MRGSHQKYAQQVSYLLGTLTNLIFCSFPVAQQCLPNFFFSLLSCPPNLCMVGNLAKTAFQKCLGHGGAGVGAGKKKLWSGEGWEVKESRGSFS